MSQPSTYKQIIKFCQGERRHMSEILAKFGDNARVRQAVSYAVRHGHIRNTSSVSERGANGGSYFLATDTPQGDPTFRPLLEAWGIRMPASLQDVKWQLDWQTAEEAAA